MDILKKVSKYSIHIKIALISLLALSTIGMVLYVQALSNSGFYDYLNNGSYKVREINTPLKLWLNGYLGIFFRVRDFGYLILFILPCYLYIILCWERISRAVKALVFVFTLSAILVGIKGFMNLRYAFTLFPFVILSIFWIAHDLLERIKKKLNVKTSARWIFYTALIYLGIGFLSIYSIGLRKDNYVWFWEYGNRVRGESMPFIHSLKNLNVSDDRKILVVNINGWFYHTDIKGVMYKSLGFQENSETLWDRMQKEKIRYVLVENYVFVLPEYKLIADILKDNSKTKLIKRGGYLYLFLVH